MILYRFTGKKAASIGKKADLVALPALTNDWWSHSKPETSRAANTSPRLTIPMSRKNTDATMLLSSDPSRNVSFRILLSRIWNAKPSADSLMTEMLRMSEGAVRRIWAMQFSKATVTSWSCICNEQGTINSCHYSIRIQIWTSISIWIWIWDFSLFADVLNSAATALWQILADVNYMNVSNRSRSQLTFVCIIFLILLSLASFKLVASQQRILLRQSTHQGLWVPHRHYLLPLWHSFCSVFQPSPRTCRLQSILQALQTWIKHIIFITMLHGELHIDLDYQAEC